MVINDPELTVPLEGLDKTAVHACSSSAGGHEKIRLDLDLLHVGNRLLDLFLTVFSHILDVQYLSIMARVVACMW